MALNANLDNANDAHLVSWFQGWIHSHMGIHYPEQKLGLLEQRLRSLCLRISVSNLVQLKDAVEKGSVPEIYKHMANVATTNHTHFYREPQVLEFFLDHILPTLPRDERVRMWSAAASSGEELYTMIILMCNKLSIEYVQQRFAFLGTDISEKVVEDAERGIYSFRRIDAMDPALIKKWFQPCGLDNYAVDRQIKDLCIYRKLNLKNYPWPFSRNFHVVMLRNVLYYFDKETQAQVLRNIYMVTEKNGWLLTSVTESLADLNVPWEYVRAGVYRKTR